jgi:ferredoxin-NADP reductase
MAATVTLTNRQELPGDTLIVHFTRPDGYTFEPGQWCFLNLPDRGLDDERGLRRHLSFILSPAEDGLGFATKISQSAFKQTLAGLKIGDQIELEDPKGRLLLPETTEAPLCFLAGGIGITPFRAMAFHNACATPCHDVTLLYSCRAPEQAAFLEDFKRLDSEQKEFRCVATITDTQQSPRNWTGRKGRLSAQMIQEEFPAWEKGTFYVAGPPKMVKAMTDMLAELEIPKERMHVEKFMGY